MKTWRPTLLYFVSQGQESMGAPQGCSNAASSFKVPPEVKLCWASARGACQMAHTKLVSPWFSHLPAVLPESETPGIMVGWEWQVYCPPFPPDCWSSLASSVCGTWRKFPQSELLLFLWVRGQALGMGSLTATFFTEKQLTAQTYNGQICDGFFLGRGEERATSLSQQSHPAGNAALTAV